MGEPPVARCNQARVRDERVLYVRRALRNPHREYEWLTGPLLPALSEIIHERVPLAMIGAEDERSVTDHQSRVRVAPSLDGDIANLCVTGNEFRSGMPHVLEQK